MRMNTLLLICSCFAFAQTVPAWRNTVDARAAEETMVAYTSNVIRCEWAGENPRVSALMPANLACQFAVVGDADVTNRVQKILNDTASAINPALRAELEQQGLLVPTLQWLARICRPGVTNVNMYTNPRFHPPVFAESDFNPAVLTTAASRMKGAVLPLPAMLEVSYVPDVAPLGKATPQVDYPDVLPEETYLGPFGGAIVLRAPELRRKIRLRAKTYPANTDGFQFVWKVSGAGRLMDRSASSFTERMVNGYADLVYDSYRVGTRLDIMVFAQNGRGLCGAPAILSIYNPPLVRRKCGNGTNGKVQLQSIEYLANSKDVLYDISPIWHPHAWRDEYTRDTNGRMLYLSRYLSGQYRAEQFAANGNLVLSLSSSGYPVTTQAVEYFVDGDTGALSYRPHGPEIHHKAGFHPLRRSGE